MVTERNLIEVRACMVFLIIAHEVVDENSQGWQRREIPCVMHTDEQKEGKCEWYKGLNRD